LALWKGLAEEGSEISAVELAAAEAGKFEEEHKRTLVVGFTTGLSAFPSTSMVAVQLSSTCGLWTGLEAGKHCTFGATERGKNEGRKRERTTSRSTYMPKLS
jgi:hypothetical protein